jgi:phosphatidylglycerophosphate synthase
MPDEGDKEPMSEHDAKAQEVWQALVAASKKSKGSLYTRYVNRNAAIPLTYTFWRLGTHPNMVSVFSSAVTHTALVLLLVVGVSIPIAVTAYVLLVLGYMLDSCDGQLARVSGKTSKFGEWLDHTLDVVKLLTFNLTLSYLLIIHAIEGTLSWDLVLGAIVLNLVLQPAHFFAIILKSFLFDDERASDQHNVSTLHRAGGMLRLLRNGADYGLFMLIVLLLPFIEVFLYVYLAYGLFYLLLFLGHSARMYLSFGR